MDVAYFSPSYQEGTKYSVTFVSVPVYVSYYPKFFDNLGSFNVCVVNGYQKYKFDNDSFNFQNFQTNINLGMSLYLIPKRWFKKPNNHWIFELGFGLPVYNFTYHPALPSSYMGLRYNFNKR